MTYEPSKPYKREVLQIIRETWDTPYLKVKEGIYPSFERTSSFPEVDHTDGIGTKGYYHWQARTFKEAAEDALAMNLNDLVLVGAVPFKLQNHLVLPEDDGEAVLQLVSHLAQECRRRKIAITGGETSIHAGAAGMDMSITMSGFVPKPRENRILPGDVLFGLPSSGLHSNGLTRVRELFGTERRPEFTAPTAIYWDLITRLAKQVPINGMMHITGGAFTKLKDVTKDIDVLLSQKELKPQNIFFEVAKKGVVDEEMYKTFNCGIGFVFSVSEEDSGRIPSELGARRVGKAVAGNGSVAIESAFSTAIVRY